MPLGRDRPLMTGCSLPLAMRKTALNFSSLAGSLSPFAALALPYIDARVSMSATGRPVIAAVFAGVNFGRMSRSTVSKPSVCRAR